MIWERFSIQMILMYFLWSQQISGRLWTCTITYFEGFVQSASPLLFLYLLISTSSCRLPWVPHNSCKSSTTHSYKGVVFLCVRIMVWLPVFGIFSACMHGDACNCTQGSADTVTEPTLEVDPGEKFFAAPGTRTHISIVPGFSAKLSTDWTIPAPVL